MTILRAIALLTALMPLLGHAQSTDFEDLTSGATFPVGNQITSNGLTFDVVLFGNFGSPVIVSDGSTAFSGQFLNLPNTIGIDVQLPPSTQKISFDYLAGCCDTGIVVNGVASPLAGSLVGLDGTTIGGAAIAVTQTGTSPRTGQLTVTGNISTFTAGGTEFWLDNVAVFVPEPSSMVMLCLGGMIVFQRRHL